MKTSYKYLFIVGLSTAISLPALYWFPINSILAHGPNYPMADFHSSWKIALSYLYSWSDGALGGINTEPSGFHYSFYNTITTSISNILHLGQGGVFLINYVIVFLSMFFLSSTIGLSFVPSILVSTLYLYNPIIFTGSPVEIINTKILPLSFSTPIILAYFIRFIRLPLSPIRSLSTLGIVVFILGPLGYSSLQYFILQLIILGTFWLTYSIVHAKTFIAATKLIMRGIAALITFLLVNIFWLLPLFTSLSESYGSRLERGVSDSSLLGYLSSSIWNSIRMNQYPEQSSIHTWIRYYDSPIVLIVFITLFAVSVSALLVSKQKKTSFFLGLLLLIGLLLSRGTLPPFSVLGESIFLSSPYITRLFRNPTYFGYLVALPYCLLIGISFQYTREKLSSLKNNRFSIAFTGLALLITVIYGYPFISGSVIRTKSRGNSSQYITVPSYYRDAMNYIKSDSSDFRILTTPLLGSPGGYVSFNWSDRYVGTNPDVVWSGKSVFMPIENYLYSDGGISNLIGYPSYGYISQTEWLRALQYTNIKYVVLHNESDLSLKDYTFGTQNIEDIRTFIHTSPILLKPKIFGKIEIFEVKPEYFTQHIVAKSILNQDDVMVDTPTLNYKKINSTRYLISVSNQTDDYNLIFSETFNPGWKLFLTDEHANGGLVSSRPISENNHVVVNEYANGWKISPKDVNYRQNYQLVLEFLPQRIRILGSIISGLTVIICFLILVVHKVSIIKTPSET